MVSFGLGFGYPTWFCFGNRVVSEGANLVVWIGVLMLYYWAIKVCFMGVFSHWIPSLMNYAYDPLLRVVLVIPFGVLWP